MVSSIEGIQKSLENIKVLELTHYIAGPYCGTVLGDLGADVIKIERVGHRMGDFGREYDPQYNDMSLYYATYNRNKLNVTLDIKSEEGKRIFFKLVEKSDVLIENFASGVLQKLGLGYEIIKKVNPRIIMTSITGYGQNGPLKEKRSVDMVIQAESGLMSMTGEKDGPPLKTGAVISDFIGSLYAIIGTLAAIQHQQKTGEGQFVDVAMLDSSFCLMENFPGIFKMTGQIPPRAGNGRPFTGACGVYKAKDGYLQISTVQGPLFARLVEMLGNPKCITEEIKNSPAERKRNEKLIDGLISDWISEKTVHEAAAILDNHNVPNGKVNTIADLLENEQIKARNMLFSFPDKTMGDIPFIANPIKLSKTLVSYRIPPHPKGADNRQVYKNILGISDKEIDELEAKGVI